MTLVSKIESVLELDLPKHLELPGEVTRIKEEAEKTIKVYKKQALRTVIDNYRKDYPLLEKVIRGETTFEKEYRPLIDKYSGIRSFFMPRWLTKEETKIPKENKKLIHDYHLSDLDHALLKPVSSAIGCAAIAFIASAIVWLSGEPFPYANITAYITGVGGFVLGAGFSETTFKNKNLLKKDIKLLDEQIKEVYQKS